MRNDYRHYVENTPIEFPGKFKQRADITYDEVFTLEHLYESMLLCARGKMWKDSTIQFRDFYDYHLYDLYDKLKNRRYFHGDFRHYTINERGKMRNLCTVCFKDRVVQKTFNRYFLLPNIGNRLIYDNMASLEGRGPSKAMERTTQFMDHMYYKYGTNYWIHKFDIKSYFDSMFHPYIMWLLQQFTTDQDLLFIPAFILNKFFYDSTVHGGDFVPIGVGLGGEVPQTFGVMYMNQMDHLIKEELGIHCYMRYQDDFFLMHPDKEYLKECRAVIEQHLWRIGLQLNQDKSQLYSANTGFQFLKFNYKHGKYGKVYIDYCRERVNRNLKKIPKLGKLVGAGRISYHDAINSVVSALGYIKQGNNEDIVDAIMNVVQDSIIDPYEELYIEELDSKTRNKYLDSNYIINYGRNH